MHNNQVTKLWTKSNHERRKAIQELEDMMQIVDDFLELYGYREDFHDFLKMILNKSIQAEHYPYKYGNLRKIHFRMKKDNIDSEVT
ncbi:hypothetical protein [Evansella tamaricis]|uniref:Uncharacterized protein n=1 Tax=Evansella tamaricis TaxID=2069301 RepID=A0ABS6JLA2_9BACI|nr:hypothetical protein [Evansella tamaricis]MBU9714451.1 hypothetical protein [Evansella tamaricis]